MTDSSTGKKASHVYNHIYLGSANDAKNLKWLIDTDIKYILNCTPPKTVDPITGTPNYFQKDKRFIYKRIPIFDNQGEDISAYLEQSFRFIEDAQHYGKILVHCHRGISRSASFVIAYMMKKNDFTRDEALAYIQAIRPIVQPNNNFFSQLATYETLLNSSKAHEDATSNARDNGSFAGPEISKIDAVIPSIEYPLVNKGSLVTNCEADSLTVDKSILGKRPREELHEESVKR